MRYNWSHRSDQSTSVAIEVARRVMHKYKLGSWPTSHNFICRYYDGDVAEYELTMITNMGAEGKGEVRVNANENRGSYRLKCGDITMRGIFTFNLLANVAKIHIDYLQDKSVK